MNAINATNCTFEMVKIAKFVTYILLYIKNINIPKITELYTLKRVNHMVYGSYLNKAVK